MLSGFGRHRSGTHRPKGQIVQDQETHRPRKNFGTSAAHRHGIVYTCSCPQSRQSAKLFLLSLELGLPNWDTSVRDASPKEQIIQETHRPRKNLRGHLSRWHNVMVSCILGLFPQSRQSAKLFLQSSELGLPHPLTRRRVCPPFGSGRGTLACGRGSGGVPIPTSGHTLWYSIFLCASCPCPAPNPPRVQIFNDDIYVSCPQLYSFYVFSKLLSREKKMLPTCTSVLSLGPAVH